MRALLPVFDRYGLGRNGFQDMIVLIRASGYVVHTLEAALWAFDNSDNFRDGALLAVNLGEDSDTIGAVYGQLAGAFYGVEAIPVAWRERVARREEITDVASRLFAAAEGEVNHP